MYYFVIFIINTLFVINIRHCTYLCMMLDKYSICIYSTFSYNLKYNKIDITSQI